MSCTSASAPVSSAPVPVSETQDSPRVVRLEGPRAIVSYPGSGGSGEGEKLKLLLDLIPADLVAVVPASLLNDAPANRLVQEAFDELTTSKRSKMIVAHHPNGLTAVLQKSVWESMSSLLGNDTNENVPALLKAFVEQVTLRREMAFVELLVPSKFCSA